MRDIKDLCARRFTPAHAGNTIPAENRAPAMEVHPRSRGEYATYSNLSKSALGSPPLTRGILNDLFLWSSLIRFTPAHAGNTAVLPALSKL